MMQPGMNPYLLGLGNSPQGMALFRQMLANPQLMRGAGVQAPSLLQPMGLAQARPLAQAATASSSAPVTQQPQTQSASHAASTGTPDYMHRFAGGRLYSTYVPTTGDLTQYGYGPEHSYWSVDPNAYNATSTDTSTPTDPNAGARDTSGQTGSHDADGASRSATDITPGSGNFRDDLGAFASAVGAAAASAMGLGPSASAQSGEKEGTRSTGGQGEASTDTAGAPSGIADKSGKDDSGGPDGEAKGGLIARKTLKPAGEKLPKPAPPDQGYVALQPGEYVIRKASVRRYGLAFMKALNEGRVDRSLIDATIKRPGKAEGGLVKKEDLFPAKVQTSGKADPELVRRAALLGSPVTSMDTPASRSLIDASLSGNRERHAYPVMSSKG